MDSILQFFSYFNVYIVYLVFFLFAFFEFLIFTWWFIPWTVFFILWWVLVKLWFYDFKILLLIWFLWSFLWSFLSYKYWFEKWKLTLIRWYKFLKPGFFKQAKELFNQYHLYSLLFGKLIPGIKESISFIAGIFHINRQKFVVFNFLNSLLWAFTAVGLWYLFSFSLEIAYIWFGRIALFLVIIFIILIVFAVIRYYLLHFGRWFLKLLIAFFNYILPFKINWNYNYIYFVIWLFFIFYLSSAYVGFIEMIYNHPIMICIDKSVSNLLIYFQNLEFINFMFFVSFLGKFSVIILLSIPFAYYLSQKKQYFIIYWMYFSLFFTAIIVYLTKNIVARWRPPMALYLENSYSFPSAHTSLAVVFYGFIFYFLYKRASWWNNKVNKILFFLVVIFTIWFSRLYLQVHYLSDVLWWYFIGFIGLILWILLMESWFYLKIKIPKFLPYVSVLILFFYLPNYLSDVSFRQYRQLGHHIDNIDNIVRYFDNNNDLKYTITISWRKTEPINFIFLAKNDKSIYNLFIKSGFYSADKLSFQNITKLWLAVYDGIYYKNAPMTPLFWNNQVQLFGFQKQEWDLKKRHHIRIWKTNLKYDGYNVYVASAVYDVDIKRKITHKIDANLDKEREYFFEKIYKTWLINSYKKVKMLPYTNWKNFSYDDFFTDWNVYIIDL